MTGLMSYSTSNGETKGESDSLLKVLFGRNVVAVFFLVRDVVTISFSDVFVVPTLSSLRRGW